MKLGFKKITSVILSAIMLGSTAGIALAANYPAPFVVGGSENGAIVVTSGEHSGAVSDWAAAVDVQSNLNSLVTSSSTTSGTVTGEAYPLFTSSSRVYLNDSINAVRNILTATELPTILVDGDFSGNVDAEYTQTISLSNNPRFVFDNLPTNDDDPIAGIQLGTTSTNHIYNTTITFDKAVNFTHADSEGEDLLLFGQKFTIGSATDDDTLVLYKSSETVTLSVGGSNPNPSETVTIAGATYTVELVAATDTSAQIRVTNSAGTYDTKDINEATSKKVNGLEVAVNLADESTATSSISAEVTIGAEKLTLESGNEVTVGSEATAIDNTKVFFTYGTALSDANFTQIIIETAAEDGDNDAITEGMSFVDPVFGTFKLDFAGLNSPEGSTSRELIEVKNSGTDKATVKFTSHEGQEATIYWYNNESAAVLADSSEARIRVREMDRVNKSEYVVVGDDNFDEGYLLKVETIKNASTGYSNDEVKFKDVFTGDYITATITAEGQGTVTIGGRQYTVYYSTQSDSSGNWLRLQYPSSATAGYMVAYPTIKTSKGARIAFYEPLTINVTNWGGMDNSTGSSSTMNGNLTGVMFPDGDGYETTLTVRSQFGVGAALNITLGGATTKDNLTSVAVSVGQGSSPVLTYNVSKVNGQDSFFIHLMDPTSLGTNISTPALIIFEEEDDNNDIGALVVKMEGSGVSSAGVGVSDVIATWGIDGTFDNKQLQTDDDLYKDMDLWGSVVTTDKSDSDQYTAQISYPDEQIYAQIYVAEEAAAITGAETSSGNGGNVLIVKDTEVSSVSSKNLIVIGGSCINSVAATILGVSSGTCGSDFTTASGVGAGQYLIKAIASPYNAAKTAVLVAGYESADTRNAATKLKESHATDIGTSQVYPIAQA